MPKHSHTCSVLHMCIYQERKRMREKWEESVTGGVEVWYLCNSLNIFQILWIRTCVRFYTITHVEIFVHISAQTCDKTTLMSQPRQLSRFRPPAKAWLTPKNKQKNNAAICLLKNNHRPCDDTTYKTTQHLHQVNTGRIMPVYMCKISDDFSLLLNHST